jgi:diguanylate cyclase (GGDEF)-like protein
MSIFRRRAPVPTVRSKPPKRSIERGLGIVALLAALLLMAAAVVVRQVSDQTIRAGRDAAHSYQIRLEAEGLSTSLALAEAGTRAYLMTGRSSSLEPYQVAHVEAQLNLSALRPLAMGDTSQTDAVAELASLVHTRFEIFAKSISAREDNGPDAARQTLDSDAARALAERIRLQIGAISQRENTVLSQSLERQARSNDIALTVMVSTSVLLAIIAFATWGTLKREFVLRRRLEQRLSDAIVEDDLTGAINRAAFERLLDQEWAFRLRYATPLSLLLIEVDNLGEVNAKHGLDAGDALLRDIARRLRARLRNTERLARYGGQQFALLVPQSLNDAAALARQLSDLISNTVYPVVLASGELEGTVDIECSIGVADASDVDSGLQLVLGAGEALYTAKQRSTSPRVEIYRSGMRQSRELEPEIRPKAPAKPSVKPTPKPGATPSIRITPKP